MALKLSAIYASILFVNLFAGVHSISNLGNTVRRESLLVTHQGQVRVTATKPPQNPVKAAVATIASLLPSAEHSKKDSGDNLIQTASIWQGLALALTGTVGMIVFMYRHKGPLVIVKVLIYLLALTTIKGAVKAVQKGDSFQFPLFLTAVHFASGAFIAFAILLRSSVSTGVKIAVPPMDGFVTRFGPIAVAFAASVGMNNMALVYSTSSFVEIVGASTPIVTMLTALFWKQSVNLQLLGPCFIIVAGCLLTSKGEPNFSLLGLALATGANVPRAIKSVLSHLLLENDENAVSYSPLEVLAWTCTPSAVVILCWSIVHEGAAPYQHWYQQGFLSHLTLTILISSVNACILNLSVLFVIKDLGAVGAVVVSQMKMVLVVLGGMCFLNEQVSYLEGVGFILVLLGVYAYTDLDARFKAKSKADASQAGGSEVESGGSKSEVAKSEVASLSLPTLK